MSETVVNNDFVNRAHEMTVRFFKIMYKSFPFYMKLYGTLCTVERLLRNKDNKDRVKLPSRDQMINQTYGKVATHDDLDRDSEWQTFTETFIINKSHAQKYYNNQSDEVMIYFNQNILDLGDKVSFNRFGKTYSFIVNDVTAYEDVIFEYRLIGIKDHVSSMNEQEIKKEDKLELPTNEQGTDTPTVKVVRGFKNRK